MSDTAFNVEDGAAPPEIVPEPAAQPAAEPEPQAQVQTPEPEGVEVAGQKMVPLAALQEIREQNRQLKQKAEHIDQVSAWYAQNKPYVDFLQSNPDLLKPRQAQAPAAPVQTAPDDDPALVELAKTLDLYTPDGKPDAKRANTIRGLVKTEAQSIAQETVRPLAEMNVKEKAQSNLRDAMTMEPPQGMTRPDPRILQQMWAQGDPKVLADPQGAAAAYFFAASMTQLQQAGQPQAIQPPAQAPVVTEPAGGRNVNRAPISDFEQRILQTRGISAQKYGDYTRNFKPGDANVLEND